MTEKDEGFAARWSRLKRRGPNEYPRDETETPRGNPREIHSEPEETERDDAEILAELGLKDPDLLEKGDDFAAFLRSAVPARLRRRALRSLWRSNPLLANLDGLNDYDIDYVGRGGSTGNLKTAYEVGSGFVRKLAETRQDEAARPADSDVTEEDAADAAEETASDCRDFEEPQDLGMNCEEVQDFAADPVRRRMRFRFDG
ncbi:MAG: DUF3306 domain-containing protein [Rhodobacteraceae bacterium]|nr:DUF3306 domain-containing protein [Paracoccaceae bacterium]